MLLHSSNRHLAALQTKAHQLAEDREFAAAYLWGRGRSYELGHISRAELSATVHVFLHLGGQQDKLEAVLGRQRLVWDGKRVNLTVVSSERRPARGAARRTTPN